MKFINPTGKGIRSDAGGDGHFGAPRGNRKHDGVDFAAVEGQEVVAPHDGLVSLSYPYADDLNWHGVCISHDRIETKLWYLEPLPGIAGRKVLAGDLIGHAQDVGKKKGYDGVTPHIHLRITKIDPLFLIEV